MIRKPGTLVTKWVKANSFRSERYKDVPYDPEGTQGKKQLRKENKQLEGIIGVAYK